MAGIFLSYAREDAGKARPIVQALEKAGHSVWWDLHVRGGAQFSKVIDEALKASDAVVVLWSVNSVDSAWVRDEAAAGRDSAKLIPIALDETRPPLGFRQFQTIDFSRWNGRGKFAGFPNLLAAVEALSPTGPEAAPEAPAPQPTAPRRNLRPIWQIGAVAAVLIAVIVASLTIWRPWSKAAVAVVAVRPSDQSPASQGLARDLLVQLGELRPVLASSMRLVNAAAKTSERPDLLFQTARVAGGSGANLVLSDSYDEILWSRQFDDPRVSAADQRQQMAFTAARVLRCALQERSGEYGRLTSETRQIYLDACANSTEIGWDTRSLIVPLRKVTLVAPKFRPAWAQLLMADVNAASFIQRGPERTDLNTALREDLGRARRIFPDMAEATVAEYYTAPNIGIGKAVALLDKAKLQDPDNPLVLGEHSLLMLSVGRIADALDDAQRAAQLDPLSPVVRTSLIRTLAFSGHVDSARAELARAKQLWPGTETVRQAEFSIDLRYGDFEKALRRSGEYHGSGPVLYVAARKAPTDSNVARLIDFLSKSRTNGDRLVFGIQSLGEMNRVDELYDLLAASPIESALKGSTYVLFRPWLATTRSDPRFMTIAKRMGLVDYWRSSGRWPDFCSDPGLKYDCKAEAARLG